MISELLDLAYARLRQLGDVPGHEFHGNQYTEDAETFLRGQLNKFGGLAKGDAANWEQTPHDSYRDRLLKSFEPHLDELHKALKARYGETVTVYRVEHKGDTSTGIRSFSLSKDSAKAFLGQDYRRGTSDTLHSVRIPVTAIKAIGSARQGEVLVDNKFIRQLGDVEGHPFYGNQYTGITQTRERAFSGKQVEGTKLSKLQTGALGEKLAIHYLKSIGFKDARTLNEVGNNFPVDLVQDHEVYEVKAGLSSNGPSSQQWRATIGQPGPKEREWLKIASKEEKRAWNQQKQKAILKRKQQAVRTVSKRVGHPVKGKTLSVIINPDTRTVDVYQFDGFHLRVGWNSEQAKGAYRGSFRY